MPLPFEFVVEGPAVSQQTRERQRVITWMQDVRDAAWRRWSGEPPTVAEVMVSITYFFDTTNLDVDNIPKPILDALAGLIYRDDSQVSDIICRKRYLNRYRPGEDDSPMLLEALAHPRQFLHIIVSDAPSEEVQP